MKLSNVIDLNYNEHHTFNKESMFSLGIDLIDTKIYTMKDTAFYEDIKLLEQSVVANEIDNGIELIILSEPKNNSLGQKQLFEFINKYKDIVSLANEKNIKTIHISSNIKWYRLFQDIILSFNIPLYLTNTDYDKIKYQLNNENRFIIEDYLYLNDFNFYSNDINNNLLIDLTLFDGKKSFYNSNLDEILKVIEKFNQTTILVEEGSYFPEINYSNVKIIYTNNVPINILENHSYVYLFTNKAYETSQIYKILYYAANSKVVFTNYNYKVNNMIPSVILNLTNNLKLIEPLNYNDAFDILNENRNTIMYNHTSMNVINHIFKTNLNKRFLKPLNINKTMDYFESNLYLEYSEKTNSDIYIYLDQFKYDLEMTLAFPLLFLNKYEVQYEKSLLRKSDGKGTVEIKKERVRHENYNNSKQLSVVVPIHNNGKYLKFKCFRSLKSLSCYNDLEIIFVDDGSNDKETLRIIRDICNNNNIIIKRYDEGSGSASRPRNEGIYIATTDLITYLDPDNEAVYDGYSLLLAEMKYDEELDMVVGDIVREDNIKRNVISYSTKVKRALQTDIINDTKDTLIKTNLTVQSIQGLIVKKNIIIDNNIHMVEGAAGQDTLYFQELLLHCNKVKVINQIIHSYYAFVEGSITNTVTHKFFEKFHKLEKERVKFLIETDLIEYYMRIKFNFYLKNWYFKKYKQVPEHDKRRAKQHILEIIYLYNEYQEYFDNNIISFIEENTANKDGFYNELSDF